MSTDGKIKTRAWSVTLAGTGINLALGVLYTWSVIKKGLPADWTETEKKLPYAIACLVFAVMMVPAGKMQDRIGPRWVASLGGLLVGIGLIVASQFPTLTGFIIGFGMLAGTGIGLGYASATPPAVKWFPPYRTGMIAGIVVAGFGLASVYISPVVKWLLAYYKPQVAEIANPDAAAAAAAAASNMAIGHTMLTLGIAFFIVVVILSQLLRNPTDEEKQLVLKEAAATTPRAASPASATKVEYSAAEMLATPQFYLLWIMYMFAAGAGLMIISTLNDLTGSNPKAKELGFILVALLAIGNAGGRVLAGMVSDKIGRTRTMLIVFLFQGIMMLALIFYKQYPFGLMVLLAMLIGANYGANLSIFPSVTKDWFGLKNFGINYGLVFTAWGVGGFVLPFLLAGKIKDWTGEYTYAFIIAAVCLGIAALLTFATKALGQKKAA